MDNYNAIQNNFEDKPGELLDCFKDTCIGTFKGNASERNPLFSIGLWNMCNKTDTS